MSDILVTSPYRPFTLPNQFKAVFNGYIYCGTVDAADPSVSPVQVYLVNESGDKVPVAQPLRTNAGGYMVYNGQPAKFVTDGNHSLLVRDSLGNQVWYAPDMASVDPDALLGVIRDTTATVFKNEFGYSAVENMVAGRVNGVAGAVMHQEGNIYSTGGTTWECKRAAVSDITDFHLIGDAHLSDFKSPKEAFTCAANTENTVVGDNLIVNEPDIPIANMRVGRVTFVSGGFVAGNRRTSTSIEVGTLTANNFTGAIIFFLSFQSKVDVSIKVGRSLLPKPTSVSEITNMHREFYVAGCGTLSVNVDYAQNTFRLLRAISCDRVIINNSSLKNFITGYWVDVDCYTLDFSGVTGDCDASFLSLADSAGIPANGNDLLLGGGNTINRVHNCISRDSRERGFYCQVAGDNNVFNNIVEGKEFKVVGQDKTSISGSADISNVVVKNTFTGTFPLATYNISTVNFVNVHVNLPAFTSSCDMYSTDFLTLTNLNYQVPKGYLLGVATPDKEIGQTTISNSSLNVASLISESAGFTYGDVIIKNSEITCSSGVNFGLYAGTGTNASSYYISDSNLYLGDVTGAYFSAGRRLNISNSNIYAKSFASSGTYIPDAGSFKNTRLYTSNFYGIPCKFEGLFNDKFPSHNPDRSFERFTLLEAEVGGTFNLTKYHCEAWSASGYCAFTVIGPVVTVHTATKPSDLGLNPNTSSGYLSFPAGISMNFRAIA